MSFKTAYITLASAVADAGTVTVPYPAGTTQASFTGANAAADGKAIVNDNDVYSEAASEIALAYGGSNVTLTNNSGVSWAAGSTVRVQMGQAGADAPATSPAPAIVSMTDSSGGTASDTLPAISATYVQTEVRDSIASLAAKQEAILDALRSKGVIAS